MPALAPSARKQIAASTVVDSCYSARAQKDLFQQPILKVNPSWDGLGMLSWGGGTKPSLKGDKTPPKVDQVWNRPKYNSREACLEAILTFRVYLVSPAVLMKGITCKA